MKKIKRIVILLLSSALATAVICFTAVLIDHEVNQGIPVLGYHSIVSDKDKEKYYSDNIYVISESVFIKQMEYLKEHDYQTLSMEDINDYLHGKNFKGKVIALTFDDGHDTYKKNVEPILKKYHFKATCFVISHKTELKNSGKKGEYQYLRKSDLVNNDTSEYYSHTYNMHHKAGSKKELEKANYQAIKNDFEQGSKIVSDKYFAYPFGKDSKNANLVLKERKVKLAFSYGQLSDVTRDDDPYYLPRYQLTSNMPDIYFKWIIS